MLVLLARQWCATPEDVVQEAFLKLSVQPAVDRPEAWLYRVVRNAALSAGRAQQRRQRHERHAADQATPWFEPDVTARLDAVRATELLTQLPAPEREVIIAHLWGGLTFEEVAQVVGGSSSAAHRLFVKGLEALRQQLGGVHVYP